LRGALESDRIAVASVFANESGDGIADVFESYLQEITATTGFLQSRSGTNGTIASQIGTMNDRIAAMEARLALKEQRLRRQFTQMETALNEFQIISNFLTTRWQALQQQSQ